MAVIDPKKEVWDKIAWLKEQIKLEEEHQALIAHLQKLKIEKRDKNSLISNGQPPQLLHPPFRSGNYIQKQRQKALPAIKYPDCKEIEAFPVTETMDAQGQAWCHHTGFDFQVIKELKTAVS